jgi:hypothetical protein
MKLGVEEIKKMKKYSVLLVIIAIFVSLMHASIAVGQFEIPLHWIITPDGTRVDADNDGDADSIYPADAWKLVNFTTAYRNEIAATGFDRENLTLYLGDDDDNNASLIRAGNLSSLDTLSNYIRNTDFNLGNVSNNTLVKGDNVTLALWNVSGSDKNMYPRDFEGNVGVNITNPTSTLHVVGTLNISPNASLILDGNGNLSIYLGY